MHLKLIILAALIAVAIADDQSPLSDSNLQNPDDESSRADQQGGPKVEGSSIEGQDDSGKEGDLVDTESNAEDREDVAVIDKDEAESLTLRNSNDDSSDADHQDAPKVEGRTDQASDGSGEEVASTDNSNAENPKDVAATDKDETESLTLRNPNDDSFNADHQDAPKVEDRTDQASDSSGEEAASTDTNSNAEDPNDVSVNDEGKIESSTLQNPDDDSSSPAHQDAPKVENSTIQGQYGSDKKRDLTGIKSSSKDSGDAVVNNQDKASARTVESDFRGNSKKSQRSSGCPAAKGQFPNPQNCGTFLNCWDYKATVQSCPTNLFYNAKHRYCDYFENVDCGERPKPARG